MGAQVTVVNNTPYGWYYATQDRVAGIAPLRWKHSNMYTRIGPNSTTSYEEERGFNRCIFIRYSKDMPDSFTYEFNTLKGDTSFILSETEDRSMIRLHCTSESGAYYCPNYGPLFGRRPSHPLRSCLGRDHAEAALAKGGCPECDEMHLPTLQALLAGFADDDHVLLTLPPLCLSRAKEVPCTKDVRADGCSRPRQALFTFKRATPPSCPRFVRHAELSAWPRWTL
ncbi:unnamed protein product [Leuciscus chuanchicus]